ncbi:hypothetical protein C8J57DRAFT_1726946 [Mycena rebaudengoi]|nr:hypothetical protein C8J57DRAFT_1726946 [Mycena rebaudengoi]
MPRNRFPVLDHAAHAGTSPACSRHARAFPPTSRAHYTELGSGRNGPHCMALCGAGLSWLLTITNSALTFVSPLVNHPWNLLMAMGYSTGRITSILAPRALLLFISRWRRQWPYPLSAVLGILPYTHPNPKIGRRYDSRVAILAPTDPSRWSVDGTLPPSSFRLSVILTSGLEFRQHYTPVFAHNTGPNLAPHLDLLRNHLLAPISASSRVSPHPRAAIAPPTPYSLPATLKTVRSKTDNFALSTYLEPQFLDFNECSEFRSTTLLGTKIPRTTDARVHIKGEVSLRYLPILIHLQPHFECVQLLLPLHYRIPVNGCFYQPITSTSHSTSTLSANAVLSDATVDGAEASTLSFPAGTEKPATRTRLHPTCPLQAPTSRSLSHSTRHALRPFVYAYFAPPLPLAVIHATLIGGRSASVGIG